MASIQFNQSSVPEEGQNSLKRKHEDDDDVEMGYEPTQEDIRLVVAAGDGDLEEIKSIHESGNGDICFQDPQTGMSVLMAAAGAGHAEVVRYLLDEGAPWNAVDRRYRCAGDYAAMNGHQAIVDIIMDHAVMSEMILSIVESEDSAVIPSNLPTAEEAASLKATVEKVVSENGSTPSRLNAAYLASRLEYTPAGDRLVDTSTQLAVMMDWERPLMARHAAWICFADVDAAKRPSSLHTLNVGFGMGIVDEEIISHAPISHTIIEAHPQLVGKPVVSYGTFVVLAFKVLEKMEATGWTQRSSVHVRQGRWQDVVPRLELEIAEGKLEPFDGVFFDTYAEDDRDLSQFHRHLPRIMSQHPRARYSYYNGMCPDSVFFHGVACETTRLRLERNLKIFLRKLNSLIKSKSGFDIHWALTSKLWMFVLTISPRGICLAYLR
ncbi:Ankyrin [Echinococcus multilocularis]|uniref:Ankyrin n=1 Tax=Echinococcus multilocularis TaxID=6211 RepID=A0A068Y604_ECHMU|nr:Ankyrin [Echinococcus multilocularis]